MLVSVRAFYINVSGGFIFSAIIRVFLCLCSLWPKVNGHLDSTPVFDCWMSNLQPDKVSLLGWEIIFNFICKS